MGSRGGWHWALISYLPVGRGLGVSVGVGGALEVGELRAVGHFDLPGF